MAVGSIEGVPNCTENHFVRTRRTRLWRKQRREVLSNLWGAAGGREVHKVPFFELFRLLCVAFVLKTEFG